MTDPEESGLKSAPRAILERRDVERVLFHPRPDYAYSRTSPRVLPVGLELEAGVTLRGRLHPGPPGAPLLLLFHGNGEIAADYDDLAPLFVALGLSMLVMDYRGYGGSGGSPTAANLLADAHAVLTGLPAIAAATSVSAPRVIVMGRSLGSAPALEIAASRKSEVAALVVESGFADTFALLARLGLGSSVTGTAEEAGGFQNAAKIARVSCPTLIIHGQRDHLIPASEGRFLYRRCGARDKRLVIIPGADHNDLFVHGQDVYLEAVRKLVSSV